MKKIVSILAIVLLSASAFSAIWPDDVTKLPVNLKPVFGGNAYVVGSTVASVDGSMAISDGDYLAAVNGVTNACQIGAGINATAGTLQYRDATVPTIAVDTNVTTDVTLVTASTAGQMLVGGYGAGTNAVWVSGASGTNDWILIGYSVP